MTYNHNDGRCIVVNGNTSLLVSTELSTAYINQCYGTALSLLKEELVENIIEIYPNPATSSIVLSNKKDAFSADDKFQIYDVTGKQMYASSITANETNIDISNYAKGLYFLVNNLNGVIKTFKFLKE
jgi:hypothetical protein